MIGKGSAIALGDIVQSLGGQLIGDPALVVKSIEPLDRAGLDAITFLANPRFIKQLKTSKAACVIVAEKAAHEAPSTSARIVVPDPYLYYARLSQLWRRRTQVAEHAGFVHPSAVIDPSATVDASATIGPLCTVGAGAKIGPGTVLKAHVTVMDGCVIGARCLLHAGVVIGADGFGFALNREGSAHHWEKIEQLGRVLIGDDVEVGANTCVDRGALADTVLCDGVKLDNLIQIGHNVEIGRHTAIAACVAIAGSAKIGAFCTIGGASSISGHISLADYVHISGATVVTKSITHAGAYTGVFPFDEHRQWEKNAAALRGLSDLRDRIRFLEKKLNKVIES